MASVQAIASKAVEELPSEFVRPEHEQPGATTFRGKAVPEIPVIDMAVGGVERRVAEAASEWGLFQVVNHGVPGEVIAELQRVGREFFELPPEEKAEYAADPAAKEREGYGTRLQSETKKTWVDFFFHIIAPPAEVNHDIWPKKPEGYRKANEEYCEYLLQVMDRLFECLSLGLGLERRAMRQAFGGDDIVLLQKINFYPPCPQPELTLGVPPHTDMSTLTILVPNDVPGLQVFRDGHWYDAKYVPNALIVHIGDQIEILSNGKYKAVLHRTTVDKEKTRMSWPVFVEPPTELVVGPHPQLAAGDNPPKYKAKKYKDYKYCKLNNLPQ